jgi:hypothetical protein
MKTSGYYEQEYASKREVIDIVTDIVTEIANSANEIEGKVLTFANLPLANQHTDKIWLVEQSSGVWLVNYKQAGLYKSDGTNWNLLDSTSDIVNTLNNKVDKLTTITTGSGLAGGGDLSANRTISHSDTSTQANVVNSGGNVLQSANVDDFGHVTSFTSTDLDARYVLLSGAYANPTWITSLNANKLTGTIPSNVLGASTVYIGTTAIALDRTSGNQALTGISSIQYVGATSGGATLQAPAVAGTTTFTLPTTSGNLIGSGDVGSVSNTMLAGSIADSKLNTITTAGKVANSATSAVSTNTINSIVLRDASGNFSAGTITGALSGNSTTATTLQTARNINGVSFNGSADITITANTPNALTISSPLTGTSFNGSSAVSIGIQTASSTLSGALSNTDWNTFNNKQATISLTTTGNSGASSFASNVLNIPNYTLAGLGGQPALNGTGFVKISGTTISYDNSTYLTGNQSITLSGDITGSGTTAITTTLANSGVVAGTYQSATTINPLTIDAKGRVTGVGTAVTIAPLFSSIASKPTTISGYGITDGVTLTGAQTLTNKTFTNNTTFFQDNLDNTKKAQFQLSNIGTATTRTYSLPNVNGTIITTSDTATVTNTMLAGSIADTKLNTITTANKVSNSATTATDLNTANAIVSRDASGNFSAGTITASLSGNSTTATTSALLAAGNAKFYTNTLPANTGGTDTYIYVGRWTTTQTREKLTLKILYNNSALTDAKRASEYIFYLNTSDGVDFTIGSLGNFYAWGRGLILGKGGALDIGNTRVVQVSNTEYDIYVVALTGVASGIGCYTVNISGGSWSHSGTNFGATIPTGNAYILYLDEILTNYIDAIFYKITGLDRIAASKFWDATNQQAAILMSGDLGSRIEWFDVGTGAPATTTRTVGTKLVLRPTISAVTVDMAIGSNGNNMWLSVPNSTANVSIYGGSTLASQLTGSGGFFGTGQITTTRANNTATGLGQIYLNGADGNRIDFNNNGVGAPTFNTRSVGTKITFFNALSPSAVDFAIGINASTLWYSVASTGATHRFYAGTTSVARIRNDGLQINATIYEGDEAFTVLNTTSTLTIAQILTLVIESTPTANITFTLPTGTNTDAGVISSLETFASFTWSIVNRATGFTITMAGNTGNTYIGNTTIAANTSATFRTQKTAANTFKTVRI